MLSLVFIVANLTVVVFSFVHSLRFAYTSARDGDSGGYPILGTVLTTFVGLLISSAILHLWLGGLSVFAWLGLLALLLGLPGLQLYGILELERAGRRRRRRDGS